MPEPILQLLLIPLVKIVVLLVVVLLIVAYLTYAERKILGYMQVRLGPNRVGPKGWLQPVADGLKLLVKEDLVPGGAEKLVFIIAPAIVMVPALVMFAVIPFGEPFEVAGMTITPYLADINIALLFILGVSSVGVFGIMLGGWSSNNKFSLMGGLRSAAQMVSYEIPMGFAIISAVLMAGTLSMVGIVEAQRTAGWWFVFPGILGFGIYWICGIAETNRNPFDLPEAEAELVAGFHTEYSGMKFALFYLAEYANMMIVSAMAVVMFLGGWLPPFPNLLAGLWASPALAWIPGVIWFLAKMSFFLFCYIWFRGTFPRYRFDQLMAVGWKWLLPLSLANVMLVGLGVLLLKG
ncbi:MAG: NADH-quinone oxidoreductase subunit NuoH [Thermoanaerobaculales bacterium]|nr:NADH-quinone oxidoreductase subunit NuoH [Thermoanaerobaculales bacterium]